MENTQSASKSPKLKLDFKDSKYATGRRKTSIAKVWLKNNKLISIVNKYLIILICLKKNLPQHSWERFERFNRYLPYLVKAFQTFSLSFSHFLAASS